VVKQNEPIIAEKILESTTKIKINSQEKDKVWVVDSNPIYYMLSNRSPAIKYYFYFPYFFKVDKIRMEVDKDLKTNIPKLIFIPEYNYFLKSKDYNIAREILTKLEDNYFINNGTYLLR